MQQLMEEKAVLENAWDALRLRSRRDPSLAPRSQAADPRAAAISPDGRPHWWDGEKWQPLPRG
jgi:hypothetical protein